MLSVESQPRCGSCATLRTGTELAFGTGESSKVFKVKSNLNCVSMNIIYALWCIGRDAFCIGQTGGLFRQRLTLHRQHINEPQYAILDVSRHIAQCSAGRPVKFAASPILQQLLSARAGR